MATAIATATPVTFIPDSAIPDAIPVLQAAGRFNKQAIYRQNVDALMGCITEVRALKEKAEKEGKMVKVESLLKVMVARSQVNETNLKYLEKIAQIQNVNLDELLTVLGSTCMNTYTALQLQQATMELADQSLRNLKKKQSKAVDHNAGFCAGAGLGLGFFTFGVNSLAGVVKTVGSSVAGGLFGGGVTECIQNQGDAVGIMERSNETQRESFRAQREILCNTLKGFLLLVFLRNTYMTPGLENTFRSLVNIYIGSMLPHIAWEEMYPVTDEDGTPRIITSDEVVGYVEGFREEE
jgi:hypothetical protein